MPYIQNSKKEVPGLVMVHCICHSLQLAVLHATNKSLPKMLEFLVKKDLVGFCILQPGFPNTKNYSLMKDGCALFINTVQ